MKVKVRKRRSPAPVAEEQVKKTSTLEFLSRNISDHGIPKKVIIEINPESSSCVSVDLRRMMNNAKKSVK